MRTSRFKTYLAERAALCWALGLAIVSTVYICVGIWLTPRGFLVNDDTGILDFIVHGEPSPYNGILFTAPLHFAYQALPGIPWYALTLYALLILSLFLWLMLLKRVFRPGWIALTLMPVFLVYYFGYIELLDYTSVSVQLCAASLVHALVDVVEQRASLRRSALQGLVFFLGVAVRNYGALGVLVFLFPMGLWALVSDVRTQPRKTALLQPAYPMGIWVFLHDVRVQAWKSELLRLAPIAFMFFAPAAVGLSVDGAYRHFALSAQERQYEGFNASRGEVHRLTDLGKHYLMLDGMLERSIHWTQEDMGYLINWKFLDERIYTPQALDTIAHRLPAEPVSIGAFVDNVAARISWGNQLFLLLISSLPLLLLSLWRRPWPNLLIAALPVYALAVVGYIGLLVNLEYRTESVYETAFSFSALVVAGLAARRDGRFSGLNDGLALALCIAVAGASGYIQFNDNLDSRGNISEAREKLDNKLDGLNEKFAGSVVVLQPGVGLAMEASDPLHIVWPRFTTVELGWSTFSTNFYREIGALSIQHGYALIDSLIDRPDAYLLGTADWCQDMLYMASHATERHIKVVQVVDFHDGTGLYRYEEDKRKAHGRR